MKQRLSFWVALAFIATTLHAAKADVISTNNAGVSLSFSSSNSYEWEWNSYIGINGGLRSTNYHLGSTTSQTSITIEAQTDCKFIFDYIISSESGYDKLSISIDNDTFVDNISGSSSSSCTVQLSRGLHTMVLKYVKDSSADSGDDRAYVSNFRFTSTQIVFNTSSDLTGKTGVTEVICSETEQLKHLCEFANFPEQLKISGPITMADLYSLTYFHGNYGSHISYLDLSDAIIEEGKAVSNQSSTGGTNASGAGGELVTGMLIYFGGADVEDYSELKELVLPSLLTKFVCNHNNNGYWDRHYITDIYSESSTPVDGIDSFAYPGSILHVPSGSKSAWEVASSKSIIVSDTPEKTVSCYAGGLSSKLTSSEIANVDILTITGSLDAEDFAVLKRMPELTKLDIRGATISSYNGNKGPSNQITSYPADEIPAYTFQNNATLRCLDFSAHSIGAYCFQNNKSIYSLNVNNSINAIKIQDYAFEGCSISTINANVSFIGDFAFKRSGIKSVNLSTSITGIGKNPFIENTYDYWTVQRYRHKEYDSYDEEYYDYEVSGLSIEETSSGRNQLLYSSEETVLYASSIYDQSSIVINDVTHTINDYALSELATVTTVTLGKNVEHIGNAFMYGCPKLTAISVSSTNDYFKAVDDVLFTIDESEIVRYPSAKGTEYFIPESVSEIRSMAFEGCKLNSLTVLSLTPPNLPSDAFANADISNMVVYVKPSALTEYQASEQWSEFNLQTFVEDDQILVGGLTLNRQDLSLLVNENVMLSAIVLPNDATNKIVTWSSSNTEVATVSSEGLVEAVAVGTAIITAVTTDGTDISASCVITVLDNSFEISNITDFEYAVYSMEKKSIAGSVISVPINLKNVNAIATWQADLVLQEGFTVATDTYGDPMITVSGSRTSSTRHSIVSNTLDDGAVRILYNSSSNKTISGTDGEVATLTLNVAEDVEPGDYPIIFRNIVMSEADQTGHKIDQIVSKITVMSCTLGDVNNDNEINAQDLVGLVNFILEIPIEGNIREAADLNGDSNVDAMDFVGEVSLILNANLGGAGAPALRSATSAEANSYLEGTFGMNSFTLLPGGRSGVPVSLQQTDGAYTCGQFDLVLPEGVHLVDAMSSLHCHSVAFRTLENGITRVLLSSASNKVMLDKDDVLLLTIEADDDLLSGLYDLTLDRILLVTPAGEAITPANLSISIRVGDATSIHAEDTDTDAVRYNLSGQRVPALEEKGVMIINGKKQLVK